MVLVIQVLSLSHPSLFSHFYLIGSGQGTGDFKVLDTHPALPKKGTKHPWLNIAPPISLFSKSLLHVQNLLKYYKTILNHASSYIQQIALLLNINNTPMLSSLFSVLQNTPNIYKARIAHHVHFLNHTSQLISLR